MPTINIGPCGCCADCCLSIPDTLTASVTGYSNSAGTSGEACADAFDVTLTRDVPGGDTWSGSVTDFDWECPLQGRGPGVQDLQISVQLCGSCEQGDSGCECTACDGTEDPGVTGCATITNFVLSDEVDPDFGSELDPEPSRCGKHTIFPWLGAFVESTCDPVYHEFIVNVLGIGSLPPSGVKRCCRQWHVIVTE
jgi:hypothetical protein